MIELVYENGSVPDQMMTNINRNAVNNFTIHISQAVVNQSDFGVYHLIVRNLFGEITVTVTVIPRSEYELFYNYNYFLGMAIDCKFSNRLIAIRSD